jgi:mono/diheme cytochrome c family protein
MRNSRRERNGVGGGRLTIPAVHRGCHGASGEGGHGGGPSLVTGLTAEKIVSVTSSGRNNMPAFAATLSSVDLTDVAAFITQDLAKKQ